MSSRFEGIEEADELDYLGAAEASDEEPLPLVVVVDTGLIIDVKVKIPMGDQWATLAVMLDLVRQGRIAFPSKVHKEMQGLKYPDAPGAWCGEAAKVVQFSDPADATMVAILRHTQDLVEEDADAAHEKADPYVVAMAYELLTSGDFDVVVATTDSVDRLPLKIAVTTACDRLGIPHWDFEQFHSWVEQQPQRNHAGGE